MSQVVGHSATVTKAVRLKRLLGFAGPNFRYASYGSGGVSGNMLQSFSAWMNAQRMSDRTIILATLRAGIRA